MTFEHELAIGAAANGLQALSNMLCEVDALSPADLAGLTFILMAIWNELTRACSGEG